MRRLLPVLPLALLLAACGGAGGGGGGNTPQAKFQNTCGSCHTLAAAGTDGRIGPDLDDLAPDVAQVQAAIEAGPGSMPGGLLSGDDAEQVAAYVANSAGD